MTLKDLQDAISKNEIEVAAKLMRSADTLITDYSKLISTLSFVKSKEMMAELLQYIPTSMINYYCPGEISILNSTIAYCMDLVKQFILKGADINFLDGIGNTPLSLAVGTGKDVKFIEELIKLGADVNKTIRDRLTPLHCASQDKDVVALLIKHGADINAKDVHGRTILLSALQFKRKDEFILELINLGADIKVVDIDGNTVVHYVQSANLIHKFVSMGIPINVKNNKGQTPLMTAVRFGDPELVKVLLRFGVDIDCFDLQLNSPFHFLKLKHENITQIVDLLIFSGCKVYTKNVDDETPLSLMLSRQELHGETIDPFKLIKYTLLANESAAFNIAVDSYLGDCDVKRYKQELSEMKLLNINNNNETFYSFCLEKKKFNKYFNETRCLYIHDEGQVRNLFPKLSAEIIMKMKTEKIRNDLLQFVDELIIQSKLFDEEADISPHSDGNNKITDVIDNSINQTEENRADSSFSSVSNPFQSIVVELNIDILYHVISYLNNIQIMNLYSATL
ncbi:uncharacterized protein LOC142332614 [Lycorma delicatula]|uniref:uncharacterized protein LOC142332614 n=1 Tax=Lycorma delicatula TaxID=130591 RepID=UPI003F51760D